MLNPKRGRKGVSPLMTTIILISIVVVTVTVVTLWGKGVQEDIQSKQGSIAMAQLSCTGVNIGIAETTATAVTVENKGADISGVVMVVKGDENTESQLYQQTIKSGDSRSFPFAGIPGVGNIEEVSVIATIGEGINRPCTDQKKELEL